MTMQQNFVAFVERFNRATLNGEIHYWNYKAYIYAGTQKMELSIVKYRDNDNVFRFYLHIYCNRKKIRFPYSELKKIVQN